MSSRPSTSAGAALELLNHDAPERLAIKIECEARLDATDRRPGVVVATSTHERNTNARFDTTTGKQAGITLDLAEGHVDHRAVRVGNVDTVLGHARQGRVLTILSSNVPASRSEIAAEAELCTPTPTIVSVHWQEAPLPDERQAHVLRAVAQAAQSIWPRWYATVNDRFDQTRWQEAEIEYRLQEMLAEVPGVSATWFRRAWRHCQRKRAPLLKAIPSAEQLRQLALALDPTGPVLLVSVSAAEAAPERIHSLARTAEWLASQSVARTLLIVPRAWGNRTELDVVSYGALEHKPTLASETSEAVEKPVSPTRHPDSAPDVLVEPHVGSPHPGSEVEKRLCQVLCHDAELKGLFQYNQFIVGFGGTHHRVDLVWPEGKVVIEVDGPEHRSPAHYRQDRERDYRLLVAGYVVVRTTNEDVVEDVDTSHTCVLAGSGSGKTVFLRRIVEEAALAGVPSIVLDGANDLSRLGDSWPHRPEEFTDEEAAKAGRYHAQTEVVVWTPGIMTGNPLVLNPIPDFSALNDKSDEARDQFNAAVAMAASSLEPLVASGNSAKAKKARAILTSALTRFGERGGRALPDLIELLREPPDDVVEGYKDGEKIAQELAELLLSATKTDPLLGGSGAILDPVKLLRASASNKVRVSVINLAGLQGIEAQQKFVNQLAMTLFTYVKKHPAKSGTLLGLFVLDEAKDFVPSTRSVPSKENLVRLVAQARKYGLGMLFATQAPKSIDHNIVANCSTLLIGKTNSPAAIETVQNLLQNKGGGATAGKDVGKLPVGTFYVSRSEQPKPIKIATSLCLSHHPSSPPAESEVIELARKSRKLALA